MFSIYREGYRLVVKILGIKFKFRYDTSVLYPYKNKQPSIKCYKYVHLMNSGIHSVSIIRFINKFFNNNEHCFIFPGLMLDLIKDDLSGVSNVFHCSIRNIDLKDVNKIIVHGLFDGSLIRQLYKYNKYLSKSYWFIWGGDLYSAPNDKKNNFIRKNFAGILTAFDKDVYESKYGNCNSYFDITYPHDLNESMLVSCDTKDYIHIQINNSEDETTIEMLNILAKFKNEKIKISTILSYKTVGHKDIRDEIINLGYSIFQDKFNPILDFMPKDEYTNHLASVDIYISNQNRQQGNGNAAFLCSLGKKVYVKSDTSVYKKYESLGIKYYDTYTIKDLSFEEFCYLDINITKRSVELIKLRMHDHTKFEQWKRFFYA